MKRSPTDDRFVVLFEKHREDITRYCLRRLSQEDAREAVTDVFEVAWRRLDDLPPADESLYWLYGVARNVVRNHQRRLARTVRLVRRLRQQPAAHGTDPATQVVALELDQDLVDAFGSISAADQEILRLRTFEELSHLEISLVLECSEDAAKQRLSRALKRLRSALDLPDPAPDVSAARATKKGGER